MNEYNGTLTRNVNDYSTIPKYAADGQAQFIEAPTPTYWLPGVYNPMFHFFKPHAPPHSGGKAGPVHPAHMSDSGGSGHHPGHKNYGPGHNHGHDHGKHMEFRNSYSSLGKMCAGPRGPQKY